VYAFREVFSSLNTKVRPTYHINCEIGIGNRVLDRDLGVSGGEVLACEG
jgi:hypothetical protein